MLFLWWVWSWASPKPDPVPDPVPEPEPVPDPEPLPVPVLRCPACGQSLTEHGPMVVQQKQGKVTKYRHSGRACPVTLPWVDDPKGY
jgi:hypothetical protein